MDNDNNQGVEFDPQDLTDVNDFTPEELADDKTDWKAKALQQNGIIKRRTTALKKAKEQLGKKPDEQKKPADQAPDKAKLDYGQKAYLAAAHGIKHAEDLTFVESVMKETGKDLESVMAGSHVLAALKQMGEERATKEATPPAGDRSGGAARDSVEYWLAKGEMPPADQVDLRRQYVNAKAAKARGDDPFQATKK